MSTRPAPPPDSLEAILKDAVERLKGLSPEAQYTSKKAIYEQLTGLPFPPPELPKA